ncbi:MAG: family transporter protein [Symbiobacteriaceae bacterium]|jgi:ABC-2 type transport system permease protein|nr:family transporter protein [Symbiobacteriaceae bacterium]
MTLFRQFFVAHLKGLFIWMAVGALMAIALTRSTATFIEGGVFEAMPASMLALYGDFTGMNVVDIYLTISVGKGTVLIPTLYAVIVALSIITREVDRRTVEFLLALPVQRAQVLLSRLAVLAVNVTLVNAVIWAVLRFDISAQGYEGSWAHLDVLFVNLWLLCMALAAVTLAASMWIDDYSVGVKLFLGLVTLTFFLEYVFRGAQVSRAVRLITPYSYADLAMVMRSGTIDALNLIVLIVAILGGLGVSFWAFNRKQFSA